MKISIFGLGYVGCVSGACFAEMGHEVIGVEPNPIKVDLINNAKSPIVETGLEELIEKAVRGGRFQASENWQKAIEGTELAIVCVGTPSSSNGSLDLRFVRRVCEQIGQALKNAAGYFTVVIRSTVLPGTVQETVIPILEQQSGKRAGVDFGICMNPEFLREGTSIHDFYHPPKTVIGELDAHSGQALVSLYKSLPGPVVRVPIRVAEMVKYVDNTFHALKVTFANEIGNLCKEFSIDSHRVMEIFCLDTKLNLSPYYFKPGFAFGGSCLPKDLRAVSYEAKKHDLELPVLGSVLASNRLQVEKIIKKLMEFKGRRLGFLGMSFKGGTDDLRESPIVELIEALIGKGFDIRIYDRHVSLARLTGANKEYIEKGIPHISKLMAATTDELMAHSDVIVVGTRDEKFCEVLQSANSAQTIVDLVRIVDTPPPNAGSYYGICW
jgi:GDP-mannose 6-dehydrogenase